METIKTSPFVYAKAWILTTRPKTLILSIIPFLVGSLIAEATTGKLDIAIMAFAALSALFIQIGTNFINDVYDFKNKADKTTRLGPKRGIQNGVLTSTQVYLSALFCFAIALILGIPLVIKGGAVICAVLLLSVICGYIYTGGPKPLAYNGLGELFVILFFGLTSTLCAFYLQAGFVTLEIAVTGLQLGCLASLPIAINNLRDIEDDALVNKKTLAVRFGKTFARAEITLLAILPFALNVYATNFWTFNYLTLFIFALLLIFNIWRTEPSALYNTFLARSIIIYIVFSLFLIDGFIN